MSRKGRCISSDDYGDYDPYEQRNPVAEDLTERKETDSYRRAQQEEESYENSAPERLHEYILEHQSRLFELEAMLPVAEDFADILEYEFLVAGSTLMELEETLAGESTYEVKVEELMELIETTNLDEQPPAPHEAVFQMADYWDTLHDIVDGIASTHYADAPDIYLALGAVVNETLDQLETRLEGSPEAVQLLRFFTRLSIFIDLLKGPGVGALLAEATDVLLVEAQSLL
jgi:hypothetical protein